MFSTCNRCEKRELILHGFEDALMKPHACRYSWCVTFELYREKCLEIREQFDRNKNLTNPKQ
ncbi:hypothetical protein SARC_12930, partial [Sphaeroforma arctica JP610]